MAAEMLVTDPEQRNNEWCRARGWTDEGDMRRLWQASDDAEYREELASGDQHAAAVDK